MSVGATIIIIVAIVIYFIYKCINVDLDSIYLYAHIRHYIVGIGQLGMCKRNVAVWTY